MKYYITKRSNLLDCDGSALHDSFEILHTFDCLEKCKDKFKSIIKDLDNAHIIKSLTVKDANNSTLISEYRKIEIFKFIESYFVAYEIIQTRKSSSKLFIEDGVNNFMGRVYS